MPWSSQPSAELAANPCVALSTLLVQVVSAVAVLSKTTKQVSDETKTKMLSVANAGIVATQLSKQPVTSDQASRLVAVVAAGNDMSVVCKLPSGCGNSGKSTARRHLMAQQDALAWISAIKSEKLAVAVGHSTQRRLLANSTTTTYVAPAFLAPTTTIAGLLASSATPGTGYMSAGDNGLYVSVANLLGRSYQGSVVAVGPDMAVGGAAVSNSTENVKLVFNQTLTGLCVDEAGVTQPNSTCSDVVVQVQLTYLPEASPVLADGATTAAGMPSDYATTSGVVSLTVGGSGTAKFPCDGCTATVTILITEHADPTKSYLCTAVTNGQLSLLDSSNAVSGAEVTAVAGVPSVQCSVNKAGSYLIGSTLKAVAPPGGQTEVPPGEDGGSTPTTGGASTGSNAPVIAGSVVGAVGGVILMAGVALMTMKKRR